MASYNYLCICGCTTVLEILTKVMRFTVPSHMTFCKLSTSAHEIKVFMPSASVNCYYEPRHFAYDVIKSHTMWLVI